ncbi:MAG TPA: hypothetical protein VGH19_07660 [Verrucomicrobiae bacterium]
MAAEVKQANPAQHIKQATNLHALELRTSIAMEIGIFIQAGQCSFHRFPLLRVNTVSMERGMQRMGKLF